MPESEAGTFSYAKNPDAMKYILEAYERIATEISKNKQGSDGDDIEQTVVMALEVVIGHIHHDHLYARAALLLARLGKQPADIESRTAMPQSGLCR